VALLDVCASQTRAVRRPRSVRGEFANRPRKRRSVADRHAESAPLGKQLGRSTGRRADHWHAAGERLDHHVR
jgi:hypothetical protein